MISKWTDKLCSVEKINYHNGWWNSNRLIGINRETKKKKKFFFVALEQAAKLFQLNDGNKKKIGKILGSNVYFKITKLMEIFNNSIK